MANAGTVTVNFAAEVARFNAQLKQVNDRVRSVESGFKSLEKVASTALRFLSVGVAARFIQSAGQAADQAGALANQIGITTERLAAFQLAAADANVSQEALNNSLLDAQKRLGEAANGTGQALKTIQAFGFNIRELQTLAPDELFARYADAIGTLKNRSDQFTAAQDLFGKSAKEAFNVIAAGRPALEAAQETVNRLSLALNAVDTQKIDEANDKLGLLAKVSQAAGQQLAAALAPFVGEFVDRLTAVGGAADGARTKFESFARAIFVTFEIAANAARTFDAAVSGVLFASFRSFEQLNDIVAKSLDLTARLDRAVGLDTIAKFFEDQAAAQRSLAEFAGAAADEASERVLGALNSIKSFEQIFGEIDRISSQAQARAEEAAARQKEINEALRQPSENPQVEAFNTNLLLQEDLQRMHLERMLEQQRIFQETSAQLTQQLDIDAFVRQQTQREQAAVQAEQNILQVRQQTALASVALLTFVASGHNRANKAISAANKAFALIQIYRNTAQAASLAIATIPPPLGFAAAGANIAFGLIQAAAVIGERAPGSRGATIGTPTNPVFTDTGLPGQTFGGTAERTELTINVVGGAVDEETAVRIAEALKNVIDGRDIRIIGSRSSQADDIRRGGS